MQSKQYTVDWFIRKFKLIPDAEWCTDTYRNDNGACCALGHCGMSTGLASWQAPEAFALMHLLECDVTDVNDGNNSFYRQPTPKERILAALADLKRRHQGDGDAD